MISFLQCIIFEPISYSEFILAPTFRSMVTVMEFKVKQARE